MYSHEFFIEDGKYAPTHILPIAVSLLQSDTSFAKRKLAMFHLDSFLSILVQRVGRFDLADSAELDLRQCVLHVSDYSFSDDTPLAELACSILCKFASAGFQMDSAISSLVLKGYVAFGNG